MTLASGTKLGCYEILAPLGAGGMGEVYKARDSRLDRTVALKVLPEEFFEDKERVARFEREAKLLAALNHPNIAGIFAFEEVSGRHLLAMELVEGDGLDAKIASGPLSLEESLSFSRQIAEALEAAHETARLRPRQNLRGRWGRGLVPGRDPFSDFDSPGDGRGSHPRHGRLHVSGTGAGEARR